MREQTLARFARLPFLGMKWKGGCMKFNRSTLSKASVHLLFAALTLSTSAVLGADGLEATAGQHEVAAALHERAARHHRAAAQHHRLAEDAVALAHAREAEKASIRAHEQTKLAM